MPALWFSPTGVSAPAGRFSRSYSESWAPWQSPHWPAGSRSTMAPRRSTAPSSRWRCLSCSPRWSSPAVARPAPAVDCPAFPPTTGRTRSGSGSSAPFWCWSRCSPGFSCTATWAGSWSRSKKTRRAAPISAFRCRASRFCFLSLPGPSVRSRVSATPPSPMWWRPS